MTLNHFSEAVAAKLSGLWPDRKAFVDRIPQESDGNFFVGIIESSQQSHLDRRRQRTVQMEVLYFLQSDDTMNFQEWAESMYDHFEKLEVQETSGSGTGEKIRTVRLTNCKARRDDEARVYQFLFDADFHFVLAAKELPTMETVDMGVRIE